MSRALYWHHVLNQEGQPVQNAVVRLFDGSDPVILYTSFSAEVTATYVQTDNNGFFQFWIGDMEEIAGYPTNSTFNMTISGATIDTITLSNIRFHFTPPRLYSLDIPPGWTTASAPYSYKQNVAHYLGTLYPVVSVYNRTTKQLKTDMLVEALNLNTLTLYVSGADPTDTLHITAIGDDFPAT